MSGNDQILCQEKERGASTKLTLTYKEVPHAAKSCRIRIVAEA